MASPLSGNLASRIFDVEMYIAAEYYNIPALKGLAATKYEEAAKGLRWNQSSWNRYV